MKKQHGSSREHEKFQSQPEFNKPVEAIDKKMDTAKELAELSYSINFEREKPETTKEVENILIKLKQSEQNENENV